MPVGQMLAWKRGDLSAALQRLRVAFAVGVLGAAVLGALYGTPFLSIVSAGIAVYLVVGAVTDIVQRATFRASSARVAFTRALRPAALGLGHRRFAHAGMGLTLLGLAATGWGVENIISMKPGDLLRCRALSRSASTPSTRGKGRIIRKSTP